MSAKDFKSKVPMRGWARRQDADMGQECPAREVELEDTVRSGLKIYRFELTVVDKPGAPRNGMRRRKSLN